MKKYVNDIKFAGQSELMTKNARKANKKMRPDGTIYIAQFGRENIYKIGVSVNHKRRISDLDAVSPLKVKEVASFWFKNVYDMEECIHDSFKKSKIRKEWFILKEDELNLLISDLDKLSEGGYYLTEK